MNAVIDENAIVKLYTEKHMAMKRIAKELNIAVGTVYNYLKVMEKHIGRPIQKDEVVHLINSIRNDNRLENLQLMTQKEHASYHMRMRHQERGEKNNA